MSHCLIICATYILILRKCQSLEMKQTHYFMHIPQENTAYLFFKMIYLKYRKLLPLEAHLVASVPN